MRAAILKCLHNVSDFTTPKSLINQTVQVSQASYPSPSSLGTPSSSLHLSESRENLTESTKNSRKLQNKREKGKKRRSRAPSPLATVPNNLEYQEKHCSIVINQTNSFDSFGKVHAFGFGDAAYEMAETLLEELREGQVEVGSFVVNVPVDTKVKKSCGFKVNLYKV